MTPKPELTEVNVPDEAIVGEAVTISVVARNEGVRAGNYSTISVSSPSLDDTDDGQRISIVDEDFGEWRNLASKGDRIYHRNGNRIDARYVLVDAGTDDDSYWASDSSHRLEVELVPESTGTLVINVRVTMTAVEDVGEKFTAPSSATHRDQQGYPVRRFEIPVKKPEASNKLKGEVRDIVGEPVPGADVVLFASQPEFGRSEPTVLARTTTDPRGRFEVTTDSTTEPVLLVLESSVEHYWFDTYRIRPGMYGYSQTLTLSRQLLLAPQTARTPEGKRVGSTVVWRYVSPSNPAEQVIYTEIAETVPSQDASIWRVDENDGPLMKGVMSLNIPDSITIAYEERDWDIPPGTLGTSSVQESTDRELAAQWHQSREPSLPMFELGPSDEFSIVTKTEHEREADRNWFFSVLSLVFGRFSALSFLGVVANVLGLLLSLPSDDDVDSVNLVENVPRANLNTQDVVSNSWSFEHRNRRNRPSTAVQHVPIRFESDEEISCVFESGWETSSGERARFSQQVVLDKFTVADSVPPDTSSKLPNEFQIIDQRDPVTASSGIGYTLEVSGGLQRVRDDGSIEPEDQIQQGIVTGEVMGDSDKYRFSGRIIAFEIDQPYWEEPARVYLNGESVKPDNVVKPIPSHRLRIEATEQVTYELRSSGYLFGKSLESGADLSRYTAQGDLAEGTDIILFRGEIAYFEAQGQATVYLDGLKIDPARLGGPSLTNRIRIDGTGIPSNSEVEYSFSVTGFAVPSDDGTSLEGSDSLDRGRVEGVIDGDADVYDFSGELEGIELEDTYYADVVVVLVNGEEIDPSEHSP